MKTYNLLPKKRPPREVDVSRPPTRMWQRAVFLIALKSMLVLLLALLPRPSWAAFDFSTSYSAIDWHPTIQKPHLEIGLCFYDTNGYDSFFTHDATEGSNVGPALYIDDNYICSPDYELAWPGESGTGNDQGLEDKRGNDGWWGNTYTKTVNGVKYTIKFWDPRKIGGRFYVTVHVFLDNFVVDHKYKVKIKGWWKTNNSNNNKPLLKERTFTFNAISNPFKESTFSVKYTDYTKATLTGSLNGTYENRIAVARDYKGKYYNGNTVFLTPNSTNFNGLKTYAKGTTTTGDMSFTLDNSYTEYGPRKIYMQHYISSPAALSGYVDCNVWNGTWITLPDFIRAEKITATPDMWKKQVTLTWETANLLNENSLGTWTIYRYPAGNPDAKVPIAEKLLNTTRKFVADVPEYDTDYIFEIEFRPKNIPDVDRIARLVRTITTSVDRVFDIKNLEVKGDKNSIELSWQAPEFKGNENYVFKVYRTESGNPETNEYNDWFRFNVRLDWTQTTEMDWGYFGLRSTNATGGYSTGCYGFFIKPHMFELQCFHGEGSSKKGLYLTKPNDGIFEFGKEYTFEMAALDQPDGTVRLIWRINGETIWDYIHDDVDNVNRTIGYFTVYSVRNNQTFTILPVRDVTGEA